MEQNFYQEFVNAQSSMLAFVRQYEYLYSYSYMLLADKKHGEITLRALDEAPDATLYKNAGKIYFCMQRDDLTTEMKYRIEQSDKELKFMYSTLYYVDKKVKESEEKVKELIYIAQKNQQ